MSLPNSSRYLLAPQQINVCFDQVYFNSKWAEGLKGEGSLFGPSKVLLSQWQTVMNNECREEVG